MLVKKEKDPRDLRVSEGLNSIQDSVLLHDYDTKSLCCCQSSVTSEEHSDCCCIDRFVPKKAASILLSESYKRLGKLAKSNRVSECGSFLDFSFSMSENGSISETGKLFSANFCRDRLCPMCSWRRSLKVFGQVSRIMDVIGDQYKFLFLTLTIPNCTADDLPETLDGLMSSFRRLMRYKRLSFVKGFFRALEITRNKVNGTYHPHFHCILAVPLTYGKKQYVKHSEWLDLWRKACKDSSITQVDIRVVKDKSGNISDGEFSKSMKSAVAEVAKYPLKDSEYLIPGNPALTDDTVGTLSSALHHRRLVAYGGVFKQEFEKFNFDDPENGDLVNLDSPVNESVSMLIVRYGWSCGIYKIIGSRFEVSAKEAELLE